MSVVRGRPPAFAGGMSGSIKRYWSSLSACPEPKSPTSARSSGVHIGSLQRGCPMRTVTSHIHRRPSTAYSDLSKRAVRCSTKICMSTDSDHEAEYCKLDHGGRLTLSL